MQAKSFKTTAAGIGAALSSIGAALSDGLQLSVDVPIIFSAIFMAALGFFSRDDNVTSEGTAAVR